MAKLTIDLLSEESVNQGLDILGMLGYGVEAGPGTTVGEPEGDMGDLMGGGESDMDDLLGGMEETPALTVADIQAAFKDLVKAKDKDTAVALVKKVNAKLGVSKIDEIPEDKIETVVNVLKAAAAK